MRHAARMLDIVLVLLLIAAAALGAWFVVRAVSGQKR